MSWNIELAIYRNSKKEINDIVPDVFISSDKEIFFDEAASVTMQGNLSVGAEDEMIVLVDPSCRLSGKIETLISLSQEGEFYFVRVAMEEATLAFNQGKEVRSGGILSRLFGKPSGPSYTQEMDGEQRAWEFLSYHLGQKCPDKLLALKYQVYELDL